MFQRILIFGLFLGGGALATEYPLVLRDDGGERVVIEREPTRILPMMPSHTETLYALGLGERVVAADRHSDYPAAAEKLPKVGDAFSPNVEAIVAAKPDLVLLDDSSGKLAAQLRSLGLTVYVGTPQRYNEVFGKIALIGKMTNREAAAHHLTRRMRREISAITATVNLKRPVSVYFEVGDGFYSAGPRSYLGELMIRAGAKNVVGASLPDWPKLDPEFIVKSNPEVVLGLPLNKARRRGGWQSIDAVKNAQVYAFSKSESDALYRPGPRLPDALRALVTRLELHQAVK